MVHPGSGAKLQRLQSDALEAVARGAPLREVAEMICRRAEAIAHGTLCSILSVDAQGALHTLAAPSLPASYSNAIDGVSIGPCVGSCGTSAWRGDAVEVVDIATDPLWADYRALILPLGLRACWSSPIKARDGRVVGTFAFYYRSRRGPAATERLIVEKCVDLCAIAIAHDAAHSRIQRLAYYDQVTGLPNRALFQDHATRVLAELGPARTANVLYIDLDDFKAVNDALGHRIGDHLLEAVAQRLRACMLDGAFLARLGGDEFAVIQTTANGDDDGRMLALRINAALDAQFGIDEHRVTIGASIGIAPAGSDRDLAELSRRADMALYEAKNAGRRTYRFYTPAMDAAVRSRRGLWQDLRAGLAAGEFSLVYQPIIALATDELVGVEALLRWRHPERGQIPPGVFIPIAEEMGLIGELGDRVLREACATAAGWPRRIMLGVNLSPLQLRKPGIVLDVVNALREAGLPPEQLDLELTESALLARDTATRIALHELHDLGIRLSLDDFGTGYASLQSLRSFPFDKIKIDMSFVRDIGIDADSAAIIRAVIRLARDLGMRTVAEGVETKEQRDWVAKQGCTEGQGFHFGKPVGAAELAALLGQNGRFGRRWREAEETSAAQRG